MEEKILRIQKRLEDLALDTHITKKDLDDEIGDMSLNDIKEVMWEMYEYIKDIYMIVNK